ncbi:HAD family hydrolase [Ancylobacter sp. IITR112]|uniref:HAD family hydrolase n=1 Tax=Ancylobacter sp. IITR112 TaxID=3138073 RepID=UPI00352BA4D6
MTDRQFLVVFDMDDTLYPERQFIAGGLAAAADKLEPSNRTAFITHAMALFNEGLRGVRNIIDGAVTRLDLGDVDIAGLEKAYRQHRPLLAPREGIPELLEELGREAGLALLSDGRQDEQRRKWAALNLDGYFEAVLFTDELGRAAWKPAPIGYQMLQGSRLAQQCVYVGDNVAKDFVSPIALGWHTVLLSLPDQIHLSQEGVAAKLTVESVDGLRRTLFDILRAV